MPGPRGLGSLAPRAGPCLIGRRAGIRSAGHPLRFYIRPHFAKWPPVAALKLHLMSPTAARPRGFTKQALCKVSFAGAGGGVAAGYQSGAARKAIQWPAAMYLVCAPAHPAGASPLRGIGPARRLPVRPPRGLPHPARCASLGAAQKCAVCSSSVRRLRSARLLDGSVGLATNTRSAAEVRRLHMGVWAGSWTTPRGEWIQMSRGLKHALSGSDSFAKVDSGGNLIPSPT